MRSDQIISLQEYRAAKVYPDKLRRVRFYDAEHRRAGHGAEVGPMAVDRQFAMPPQVHHGSKAHTVDVHHHTGSTVPAHEFTQLLIEHTPGGPGRLPVRTLATAADARVRQTI